MQSFNMNEKILQPIQVFPLPGPIRVKQYIKKCIKLKIIVNFFKACFILGYVNKKKCTMLSVISL